MQADIYTRFMLGVVAACLALLVAQGFGIASSGASARGDEPAGTERYKILPLARGRVTVRLDSATGETWRLALPGRDAWEPMRELTVEEAEARKAEAAAQRAAAAIEVKPREGSSGEK